MPKVHSDIFFNQPFTFSLNVIPWQATKMANVIKATFGLQNVKNNSTKKSG